MSGLAFSGELQRDKDGTWWYVRVPGALRKALADHESRGMIPVTATIGMTKWAATLLPWADGSAQIVINRKVRDAECLELGQPVHIRVEPRTR